MRRLAIDTSSVACTVAVQFDDRLVERHEEQPREHTRLLMPMIREALQEIDATPRDLDAIVLGNGPGSFIGMRIAAAVAQGIAHGAGLNIIPVSSLAAVAAEVFQTTDAGTAAIAQDAHMNEVYLGIFERGLDNLPKSIAEERLQGVAVIEELTRTSAETAVAAGYGWIRYPEQLSLNAKYITGPSEILYPKASFLLRLSEAGTAMAPANVEPAYLRQKVAEKSVRRQS